MSDYDRQQQWYRLTEHYRALSDDQLLELSKDSNSLTELASQALTAEMNQRGLQLTSIAPHPVPVPPSQQPAESEYKVDPRQLIPIRRFRDLTEAMLAKAAVESAGIACELADENIVRMDWFISNLVGGVKLLVQAENFKAAEEVLNQPIPASFDVENDGQFEQPTCPKCGSLDISYEALNKPASFASAFIGIPIPFRKDAFKCHACGIEWQEVENEEIPKH